MQLTFWGAAGETTGSHHLLDVNGERFALDCGLYQGRRQIAREYNETFACPPAEVDAVVLSHAHIDHCGNLPTFVKNGFDGPIYATAATGDLVRTLLLDSAFIQEKDAEFVNKINKRKKRPLVEPLYTIEDAQEVFPHLVTLGYYRPLSLSPHVDLKFLEAGHILGSAIVELDVRESGHARRLVFSGDLGRGENSILRDPEIPSDADYLILESTYGNRSTEPRAELKTRLRDIVARTARRGGKVIIPAFSVGRTQEIVYQLNVLFNEGELPAMPCYVDSPLSANVTEVFRNHPECYNRPVREILLNDPNPFGFERLTYIRDVEESKNLNTYLGPCIIVSASGMCEHGRILHHLRNNIEDPKNTVLIVGFQAEHTLGRRIVERREVVRIFGDEHPLRAEVEVLNGFSAHADADELRDFAFRVMERGRRLKKIFLVHGEEDQQRPFAEYLRKLLNIDVIVPERGQVFQLG